MAIVKEEVISILNELPEDATLVEIERAIIIKTIPTAIRHIQKVKKQIHKFEKINRQLNKFIQKADLNPRYFEKIIPIEKAKALVNTTADYFHLINTNR